MKKLVCMALSAALLAGSVPAYAADYITKVPHTFTAKVGTMEFTKDGEAQKLDVPIYIKDGYAVVQNEITLADGTKDVEWGIIQNPNR